MHSLISYDVLLFISDELFVKYQTDSKIIETTKAVQLKNVLRLWVIVVMIIVHRIVQNLYVAIFTGIPFIVIFNLLDKPKWLANSFNYIGGHSTNLWLTHMFFYMIYFKQLVYAPKNPILIFIWLVVLCLGTSHFIHWLDRKIMSSKTYK